jgi:hypothetical protein
MLQIVSELSTETPLAEITSGSLLTDCLPSLSEAIAFEHNLQERLER